MAAFCNDAGKKLSDQQHPAWVAQLPFCSNLTGREAAGDLAADHPEVNPDYTQRPERTDLLLALRG